MVSGGGNAKERREYVLLAWTGGSPCECAAHSRLSASNHDSRIPSRQRLWLSENEKSRLILTVFAIVVQFLPNQEKEITVGKDIVSNEVVLDGYLCKKPIYRKTPFGREISDILLAVNRAYNKSDYIPCIAWGRTARFCENLAVGTELRVIGRVQSREYEKKYEDGTVEKRIAYEVSVSNLEINNKEDNEKEVEETNQEAM